MPAILIAIWSFLSSRFLLVAAFMSNMWLVMASSRAAMWAVRGALIVGILLWLPLPAWLTGLPTALSAIPESVAWGLGVVEFKAGLGIVLGAWALRIVVRLCFRVLGS